MSTPPVSRPASPMQLPEPEDAFWQQLWGLGPQIDGVRSNAPSPEPSPISTPDYVRQLLSSASSSTSSSRSPSPSPAPPTPRLTPTLPATRAALSLPSITVSSPPIIPLDNLDDETLAWLRGELELIDNSIVLRTPLPQAPADEQRAQLQRQPLHESAPGRCILGLTQLQWYRLEDGVCVAHLADGADQRAVGQLANFINWLNCGARAHRCLIPALAVQGFGGINTRLSQEGHWPIYPTPGAPPWMGRYRDILPYMSSSIGA